MSSNLLKTKIDESKAELKEWMDNAGTEFGPAVWYRAKADGSLELYGYDQTADGDNAPEGEGWVLHKEKYFYYMTKEKDDKGNETGNLIEDPKVQLKLKSFYNNDPDTRQWWPIFNNTLTNSQGMLVNDYGF